MRWLIVLPFARPGLMGMDFGDELTGLGHEVRLFPYRRDNPLYKNTPTKAAYQRAGLPKDRVFALKRKWRNTCEEGVYGACLAGWAEYLEITSIAPAIAD